MNMFDYEVFFLGENIIIFFIDWYIFWVLRDGIIGIVMFLKFVNIVRV